MLGDQALKLILEARNVDATGSLKPYNEELVRLTLLETRQLQDEIDSLISTVPGGPEFASEAAERDPQLAAQLLTHHLAAQRNKRCLLAYHEHRIQFLKARLWDRAGSIALVLEENEGGEHQASSAGTPVAGQGSGSAGPQHLSAGGASAAGTALAAATDLRSKLSPSELAWLRNYAALVTAYKAEFLDILDVASPLCLGAGAASAGVNSSANYLDFRPPDELMVTVVATRDARDIMTEMGTLNLRRGERMRVRRTEVEGLIVRGWLQVTD